MRDDSENDRLEPRLHELAEAYHRPPAVPRDEMWAAMVEARHAAPGHAVPGWGRRWIPWGLAAAAVLVLGIAIGRVWEQRTPPGSSALAEHATAPAAGVAYRVAAGQHLARVDALLAQFRADARTLHSDGQLAGAARNLLAQHRLLLDSPAARDPRLRALLDDLELVLAEIAQISAGHGVDGSDLILQALEHNGVLLRLHSAMPSDPAGVSTRGAT